jgi:multisubunit Na+/H+ antiporter MnhF subunit
MKYSNTARVLSFLLHLILVLAFGTLGVYFGFFAVPFNLDSANRMAVMNDFIAGLALNLDIELAVLGLSIFTISLYGMIQGIKSLLAPNDDKPVVKSFVAFIGDGYIASGFFAACAFLYFDPIANKNLAFAIVMCVLFMIILLIATNIPMYRLFEGKETTEELVGLSFTAAIAFFYVALMNFLAFITCQIVMARQATTGYGNFALTLGIAALGTAIVAGFMAATGFILRKKGVGDKKAVALTGYLTSGAFLFLGGSLLSTGIMELLWKDTKLVHLDKYDYNFTGVGYGIMCLVIGALAVIGAIAFAVFTAQDSKKAEAKA